MRNDSGARCRYDSTGEYSCIGSPCILCSGPSILPLAESKTVAPDKTKKKAEVGLMDKQIGARVRAARLEARMSQEKLGEALGLTFQQVQKYEKGTNRIAGPRLIQIGKALSKPTAYFLHNIGDAAYDGQQASDDLDTMLGTTQGRDLVKHWHLMKPIQRSALLVMAEALLWKQVQ